MNTLTVDQAQGLSASHERSATARLSINVPAEVMTELKLLADKEAVSITEIVRRAISAERFLREQQEKGNQILILERGQTKATKVVLFR